MMLRWLRSKWLLGFSLFLLLGSIVLILPIHPPQAQVQSPTYLIENLGANHCLDSGNQASGYPYLSDCDVHNSAQLWTRSSNFDHLIIRNVGSGACLDHGNATTPSFQIYLFDCHDGPSQAFSFTSGLRTRIGAGSSGLVLDGAGNIPTLATPQSGNNHQGWILRWVE